MSHVLDREAAEALQAEVERRRAELAELEDRLRSWTAGYEAIPKRDDLVGLPSPRKRHR